MVEAVEEAAVSDDDVEDDDDDDFAGAADESLLDPALLFDELLEAARLSVR